MTSRLPKFRPHYISVDRMFGLHTAAREIERAFPDSLGCYLVGSSLERKDYRDVDVRCILHDADFEALFPIDPDTGLRPRFMLMCLALSAWFNKLTGLPVDFQFQKMTVANEKHKGARNALGMFAWTGDAT